MDLFEELGRIQFQLDKLKIVKDNVVRRIEIAETIEALKQKEKNDVR